MASKTNSEDQLYDLVADYEANDVYVAYDYFLKNELPLSKITEALNEKSQGEEWDSILPKYLENKEFNNYKVLSKEEIQELLNAGYSPDDIIQGDSIARAKDKELQSVLQLKNSSNTWDSIAKDLGVEENQEPETANIIVPNLEHDTKGKGVEDVVYESNKVADEREKEKSFQIKTELGISDEIIQAYTSQGFNIWEIRNAYKLAKKNDVAAWEVLQKKKQGMDWQEIVDYYTKQ